jgi:hypothetical protein
MLVEVEVDGGWREVFVLFVLSVLQILGFSIFLTREVETQQEENCKSLEALATTFPAALENTSVGRKEPEITDEEINALVSSISEQDPLLDWGEDSALGSRLEN